MWMRKGFAVTALFAAATAVLLTAVRAQTVGGGLRPAAGSASQPATASTEQLATWIAQLGSDKVAERDAAQKALLQVGEPATAALRVAAEDKDPERAVRAKAVLDELTAAARRKSHFAIYLVTDPVGITDVVKAGLDEVRLGSNPLFVDEDVEGYDGNTHRIVFVRSAKDRLPDWRHTLHVPFVVVADGQRCFLGSIVSPISSYAPLVPTMSPLAGPDGKLRLSVKEGELRIVAALVAAGKIRGTTTQSASASRPTTRPHWGD